MFAPFFKATFAATAVLTCGAALAQPAVIYDMGGKFDKSFNQAAYDGAERWKKETGKPYLEFEISNPTQREQAKRRMAERGADPIVGIGFSQGSAVEKVAKDFQSALRHHRQRGQTAQRAEHRVQGA